MNNNSSIETNDDEESNLFEYMGEIITVMGRGFYWNNMLWPQIGLLKGIIDSQINKKTFKTMKSKFHQETDTRKARSILQEHLKAERLVYSFGGQITCIGEFNGNKIISAMEEYAEIKAKQKAIAFIFYLKRFRDEERRRWGKAYEKAGGILSWVGKPDEEVYDNFINLVPIKSESMPGVIYTYDTGSEKNNVDEIVAARFSNSSTQDK